MENKVTLQISLSPGDYPYARHILPHQLKVLAKQVDEVILTIDTRPSKGRFGEGWHLHETSMYNFLAEHIKPFYPVSVLPVDYTTAMQRKVAHYFFGKNRLPAKDFRGGPFYAYFYGLFIAKNDLVFHLDADMLLGGASPAWVNEAAACLNTGPGIFTVSPLPGPPHPDDVLIGQSPERKPGRYTYLFKAMSTRIFMIDRSVFRYKKINFKKPDLRNRFKAMLKGHPAAQLPEDLLSDFMEAHQLKRIDFSGSGEGLWSLHPPYRTKTFLDNLPGIIKRVEENNLPPAQAGFYDLVDEVCDWSEAREKLSRSRLHKIFSAH